MKLLISKSLLVCALCASLLTANRALADPLTPAQVEDFEIHVRPLLVTKCLKCHGETKQEGGLRLLTLGDLLRGGDSGPALVVGKPDESLIVEALRYETLEMPPEEQLPNDQVGRFVKWIASGAHWPDGVSLKPAPKITQTDREWWCYQPIGDPDPPTHDNDRWPVGEIDRFVLAKLKSNGLRPAEPADALALARRASFALTGLPPDETTIHQALLGDISYDALVDRLLESQAYGENQARFWLDLARYADSDGYRADHGRPQAYRYRDYVIRSFNDDKPYDRFIREQLAGDELYPASRDAITATMYLRHWIYEHNQRDVETQWHEILSDITETTSDVFLAQGLKCAKCHDHKFDPLLQKDYFRMKAFFAAFQPVESHPIASADERAAYRKRMAAWEEATGEIRSRLREIEYAVALEHATREGFEKFVPKIQAMIKKLPRDRDPYEQQIASLSERQFDLPYDKLKDWLSEEDERERQLLKRKLAEFDELKPKPLPTMGFVATDVAATAPVTFIPNDKEKTPIDPGFLTLLDATDAVIAPVAEPLQTTGRRSTLANWIASSDNPLTARVMVNRIWQQHFGRGLVETSSDFGQLGSPPSHPDLLDWLASRFIEDGWSIKKLHRRILTSATYRQTSRRNMDDHIRRVDPGNVLLWRMDPRRLSGEEIHDCVLTASGELKTKKRAIYKTVKRNSPDPLLAAFDGPDRIRSMGKRHRTTTSSQSLLLANGSWSHEQASLIANRMKVDAKSDETFVDAIYLKFFGRSARSGELKLAQRFLANYIQRTPVEKTPPMNLLVDMPGTGSKAIDVRRDGTLAMSLRPSETLPESDFTVEAIVLLRSLHKNASVNTILTQWNGSKSKPGWSLGVTSEKSAYKPRNLILQLVGTTAKGDLHYEVIASNLRPELGKPYYVAASIKLDDTSEHGVTFYLRDLSKKDAPLQTAQAKHTVIQHIRPDNDISIASRFGSHAWDGLIDSIRIENRARDLSLVSQADSDAGLPEYVVDWQFNDGDKLGHDDSGTGNHAWAKIATPAVATPHDRARIALVHALLNSNEFIYVD